MSTSDLPIDIHANKLLDWLISRRHCDKNFQNDLNQVRDKIVEAIKDMPQSEKIERILSGGSQINYYTCLAIVDVLKETEVNSKNLFGYYSSQRMKDWQEIIKMYQKDYLHLAESAQIISRNVNYDIPSLKKQLTKLETSEEELRKKSTDYLKQSNTLKNDLTKSFENMEIEGKCIRRELFQLILELPKSMEKIVTDLKQLKEGREYYQEFLKFIFENDKMECLETINYLLTKGNTTYYQYRTGQEPESVEEIKMSDTVKSIESLNDDQIDFRDGIDFGEDTASSGNGTSNGDFEHIDKIELQDVDEVNWDINTSEVSIIESPSKIARGVDAMKVIEYQVSRCNLMNDLIELKAFFEQRIFEMSDDSNVISSNLFQDAPPFLQLSTTENLENMLIVVNNIIEFINCEKVKQLFLMNDNSKYIDKIEQKLKNKKEMVEKFILKSEVMIDKSNECVEQRKLLMPKIPELIQITRHLQNKVENEISKLYKNRPVHIVAGAQIF